MTTDFYKFPSTPHLVTLPGVDVRDDKVVSADELEEFLQHDVTVEEKIDGANLGISFDSDGNIHVQNRGAFLPLPGAGQWKKLDQWLAPKTDSLFESLSDRYILFGEWCYAQHAVSYERLPDWFLGFDLYDKQVERFLCVQRRDDALQEAGIIPVPVIARGRFTFEVLKSLLSNSVFSDGPAEGLYLRLDRDEWLHLRAKLVRPAFVQSMDRHWSRSGIKPNRLGIEDVG